MINIVDKIREIRTTKGFSQEYMALQLQIDQSNYYRIENKETKLTVDRFLEILKILGVSISHFFDEQNLIIQNNDNNSLVNGHVGNLVVENDKLYEKIIASKDELIEELRKDKEMLKLLLTSFHSNS